LPRKLTAIAAGLSHGLALKADGTVVGWGNNMSGRAIGSETEFRHRAGGKVVIGGHLLNDIVAISAGQQSLALKRDGLVVSWGRDLKPPSDLSNVKSIAAGGNHSLALKEPITIVSWHSDGDSTHAGMNNVTGIAASPSFHGYDLAIVDGGRVVRFGGRQRSSPETLSLSNMISVAAGSSHYLALSKDGTVVEWGSYDSGFSGVAL